MADEANLETEALTDIRERPQGFRVEPHPLAVHPRFRQTSMNQLYDQIEAQQAARLGFTRKPHANTTPPSRYSSPTTTPE